MKGFATLALVGAAAAAPHAGHQAFHKKDALGDMMADVSSLVSEAATLLTKLGAKPAVNSLTANTNTWIGAASSGPAVVNTIVNNNDKDAMWTCWGADGSWVNAIAPTISVKVPAGKNITVSHAIPQDGSKNIGGCSAVFPDTQLLFGQISQSWMEFTFVKDQYFSSTFDLSMEPNMAGQNMTIASDKCTSNTNTCVFSCKDKSAHSCWMSGTYELINCTGDNRSNYNLFGNPEGGCHGIDPAQLNKLTTTLH